MISRMRFKQTSTLEERLLAFAKETREKATALPVGPERDDLLQKAARAEDAAKELAFYQANVERPSARRYPPER